MNFTSSHRETPTRKSPWQTTSSQPWSQAGEESAESAVTNRNSAMRRGGGRKIALCAGAGGRFYVTAVIHVVLPNIMAAGFKWATCANCFYITNNDFICFLNSEVMISLLYVIWIMLCYCLFQNRRASWISQELSGESTSLLIFRFWYSVINC